MADPLYRCSCCCCSETSGLGPAHIIWLLLGMAVDCIADVAILQRRSTAARRLLRPAIISRLNSCLLRSIAILLCSCGDVCRSGVAVLLVLLRRGHSGEGSRLRLRPQTPKQLPKSVPHSAVYECMHAAPQ